MSPCREFQGARTGGGYGHIKRNGKEVYLHRWVVAQVLGWEAIKGKVIRHTCDNPPCFLYEHLLVGTHADNSADMVARGRNAHLTGPRPEQRRDTCRFGHPITERNGRRGDCKHRAGEPVLVNAEGPVPAPADD